MIPLNDDLDPLGWAKRPKSAYALHAVIETAKVGDPRFMAILEKLVADGVCTEAGKLLLRWDGMQWMWVSADDRYREAA